MSGTELRRYHGMQKANNGKQVRSCLRLHLYIDLLSYNPLERSNGLWSAKECGYQNSREITKEEKSKRKDYGVFHMGIAG